MISQTESVSLGQLVEEIMHTSAVLSSGGNGSEVQAIVDEHHHRLRHPSPDCADRRAMVRFIKTIATESVWDIAFGLDSLRAELLES